MAQPTLEPKSTVPEHLRPFFRPSFTTEPQLHHSSTTSSAQTQSSDSGVELCPPHWRIRPPKRTVRETLTDILLKDWQGTQRQREHEKLRKSAAQRTVHPASSSCRPEIMRMKDSDDYITARAANPRTGLISPSIGSRTPHAWTPETPGEALELIATEVEGSPCPSEVVKIRPPLQRANEARKVSAESAAAALKWRPDGSGWTTEKGVAVLSPRVAHIKADAGVFASKAVSPLLGEDRFVVRMPSAREPQPYAYPGYSGNEIEALEGCKRGMEREGRVQMVLKPVARKPVISATSETHGGFADEGIRVAKRKDSACEIADDLDGTCDCSATDEKTAATFAPFSSPRTPKLGSVGLSSSTPLRTLSREFDAHNHHHKTKHTNCGAKNSLSNHHHYDSAHSHRDGFIAKPAGMQDLRHLPQVKLVHPAHAGIPHSHSHSHGKKPEPNAYSSSNTRSCSLGCPKDPNSNVCLERRRVASHSFPHCLFDEAEANLNESQPSVTPAASAQTLPDLLLTALIALFQTTLALPRHLPSLPRPRVLDILSAADASPTQKARALKGILVSAGQIMVVLVVLGLIWELGGLVGRVVGWIFWPLGWVFRVGGWVVGGV